MVVFIGVIVYALAVMMANFFLTVGLVCGGVTIFLLNVVLVCGGVH